MYKYVYKCMCIVTQLQFLQLAEPYLGTEIHESASDLSFMSLQRGILGVVVNNCNCQLLCLCSLKLQKRSVPALLFKAFPLAAESCGRVLLEQLSSAVDSPDKITDGFWSLSVMMNI